MQEVLFYNFIFLGRCTSTKLRYYPGFILNKVFNIFFHLQFFGLKAETIKKYEKNNSYNFDLVALYTSAKLRYYLELI